MFLLEKNKYDTLIFYDNFNRNILRNLLVEVVIKTCDKFDAFSRQSGSFIFFKRRPSEVLIMKYKKKKKKRKEKRKQMREKKERKQEEKKEKKEKRNTRIRKRKERRNKRRKKKERKQEEKKEKKEEIK